MKYLLLLPILFAFLVTACSTSEKAEDSVSQTDGAEVCKVAGHSTKWEFAYCMSKTNVEDTHSKVIQSCIDGLDQSYGTKPECEKRFFLKKQMCQLKVKRNQTKGGVYSCLNNKVFEASWL